MTLLLEQWPILALVIVPSGIFLRVIQKQYLDTIQELRKDVEFYRELALNGTRIADTMTSVVEHTAKRQR